MKKFFSNNWVIGIGLLILGPIVLKIIDAIAKTNILGGIWDYIKPFFTFFVKDFNISIWVFILILIGIVILTVLILWFILANSPQNNSEDHPDFLDYVEDTFHDVLYKWEYVRNGDSFAPRNITAYCLKDNCKLLNYKCLICKENFNYHTKSSSEISVLIGHKVNNNLF